MTHAYYGKVAQAAVADATDVHIEEIRTNGYTVLHGLFDAAELEAWRARIDRIYAQQEQHFGRDGLAAIQETDVCRAPLLYDFHFASAMAHHPAIMDVMYRMLGEWVVLNLQNAVINRPGTQHHQAHWHRDIPHQNFIMQPPVAINALVAIDPFTAETGGTQIIPFSHRTEALPSNRYIDSHCITAALPAGSAILFDAMVYHRAGQNSSTQIRRAVNHLYTVPVFRQQYDFPRALGTSQPMNPALTRLLGFESQTPLDDVQWREARRARLGKSV